MKLLGGTVKPSHTLSKLPETSQSGTPRNGTARMCITTSKSGNLHTRTDLPKLENTRNILKTHKVSTKIDKIRRIWETEKSEIDMNSANRPICEGPIGVEMYHQNFVQTNSTNSGLEDSPRDVQSQNLTR